MGGPAQPLGEGLHRRMGQVKMPYAGLPSQLEAPVLKPKKLKIKFGGALFVNNGAVLPVGCSGQTATLSAPVCRPPPLYSHLQKPPSYMK